MASRKAPWKRANPKSSHKKLAPAEKRSAKARAAKAGRPYPNLVDNMNAAKKRKAPSRRKAASSRRASRSK